MNKYLDKLKTREVRIDDIYDFNMIYNYFSTWKELDKFDKTIAVQGKYYLKQFIGAKEAIYEHYNPFTGFKSVPQEIEILTYIPFGVKQKLSFPKEFKNIVFSEISNTLYYNDNINM